MDGLTRMILTSFEVAPWGWTMALALVVIAARLTPIMRKLSMQREITLLEARARDNGKLARRVSQLERRDALRQAESTFQGHQFKNVTHCFDSIVLLIEQDPSKALVAVERIKTMRAEQIKQEEIERKALYAIAMQANRIDLDEAEQHDEADLAA